MRQPRSFLFAILALVLLAVGSGAPWTALPVLTRAVVLAIPAALALPAGIPPLWIPGTEPVALWVVNVVAVAVMIAVAWRYMTRAGGGGRWAVWRRVAVGVMLGLVLANIVRAVAWSFYTGPSLGVYGATVALSAVVSAVVGALVGALIGGLAAAPRS